MDLTTIRLDRRDAPGREGVVTVFLSRPEVRNAFNEVLIAELTRTIEILSRDRATRVIVLAGDGVSFCAGADLNWMAKMVSYGLDENRRDSQALASMYRILDECEKPVVGRVQGAALGGGTGLAAVCDVVVAAENALFGTTEVRLGILPAVISPYVVRKIGESRARLWFLLGDRIAAAEAREAGLVHRVVPEGGLDEAVEAVVGSLLAGGPEALGEAKALARTVGRIPLAEAVPLTVEAIGQRRVSPEGQEGMSAFLSKRRPAWAQGSAPAPAARREPST